MVKKLISILSLVIINILMVSCGDDVGGKAGKKVLEIPQHDKEGKTAVIPFM